MYWYGFHSLWVYKEAKMDQSKASSGSPKNEVDNIRNILFGDQINQMEERFVQLEKSISQLRTENRNVREALEAEVTQRENAFQTLQDTLHELDKKRMDHQTDQGEMFAAIKKAIELFESKAG